MSWLIWKKFLRQIIKREGKVTENERNKECWD